MALEKELELDTGFVVSYRKVYSVYFDLLYNCCEIGVASYANREARDAGKKPYVQKYSFSEEKNPIGKDEAVGNPIAVAYAKLKELPEFSEARDV